MPSMTRCPSAVTSAIQANMVWRSPGSTFAGDQVRAVQRHARGDTRMVRAELAAEIEAFLPVGPARGQFAAERKPAAPGPAAERHRDRALSLREGRRSDGQVFEPQAQRLVDAVADDVESPVGATGFADASRDLFRRGAQIDQGRWFIVSGS